MNVTKLLSLAVVEGAFASAIISRPHKLMGDHLMAHFIIFALPPCGSHCTHASLQCHAKFQWRRANM